MGKGSSKSDLCTTDTESLQKSKPRTALNRVVEAVVWSAILAVAHYLGTNVDSIWEAHS